MKYKTVRRILNGKTGTVDKNPPILKARGYNDIRFRTVFFDGEWLKKGPMRVINILTKANEFLWPVRGRIYYDRKLESFVWDDLSDMKRYLIKYDGSLGRRL